LHWKPAGDTAPTSVPPPQTTPVTPLSGSLGAMKGMKKSALKKGYPLRVTCTVDSKAAVALTVAPAMARKLKLKTLTIGTATGQCKATGGGKLMRKLRLSGATVLSAAARRTSTCRRTTCRSRTSRP
jgi:hypothetical protein